MPRSRNSKECSIFESPNRHDCARDRTCDVVGTADLERERSRLREAQRLHLNPPALPLPHVWRSIPSLTRFREGSARHGSPSQPSLLTALRQQEQVALYEFYHPTLHRPLFRHAACQGNPRTRRSGRAVCLSFR